MKRFISFALFFLILILVPISSCFRVEQLPPEPSITFTSFEIFDTTDILDNKVKGGRLNFSFIDGDGDLGLDVPTRKTDTDTTNLFFILYRKTGGVFKPAPSNDPLKPSPFRIPYMDRQGQNKILRGSIKVTFLYLFSTPSDTIMYKFFVKDRAENYSDTVQTCEITFARNNFCNK